MPTLSSKPLRRLWQLERESPRTIHQLSICDFPIQSECVQNF